MKRFKNRGLPSRISIKFLTLILVISIILSGFSLLVTEPEQIVKADSENVQVESNSDDCVMYWDANVPGFVFSTTVAYITVGKTSTFQLSHFGGGMRFQSIDIPSGATISNAYISLKAYSTKSTTVIRSRIRGEDVDDAATFSTKADYQARRGTIVGGANDDYITTAVVDWDNIGTWTNNVWYNSPNISTVVQEIIDRGGWSSGNDMVIFWDDHDNRTDSSAGHVRQGTSHNDGAGADAPKLYITYSVPATPPTVTTSAATNVEETTATLNGEVTNTGGENNDEQGFYYDIDSGTPYANNQTSVGSFGTGVFDEALTGLTQGELYYFQAISHNSDGWGNGSELTFFTKPEAPTGLTATAGCGTINLTWNKGTGADNTEIWAKENSYPSARGDGSLTYNSTGTTHSDTNPEGAESWYYRAWSYATEGGLDEYSDTYTQDNATSVCQVPTVVTYNVSSSLDTWADLYGNITAIGASNATQRGFQWDTDTGSPYTYNATTNGSYGVGAYTYNSTGLTEGELYYYRACANNSDGWGYGNEVTFLTRPDPPTSLANTSASSTTIDFSWTNGNGSQQVTIRYRDDAYPQDLMDGTLGHTGNGTTGTVSNLTVNTTYYFSAWGYATEGSLERYSATYDTVTAATVNGPICVTLNATSVEETTATLQGNVTAVNGGNITLRGFEWDTSSGSPYSANWTETGNWSAGTFSHGLTVLTKGEAYYYRAFAENDNNDWGYGSEISFITKPDEPTALTSTGYTSTSISLSWTKGDGADNTIIHYSTTGYPTDYVGVTGSEAYNDIGTTTTVTSLSPGQIYYFSAWSYAEEDSIYSYSDTYDTATDYTSPADVTNFDAYNPAYSSIDLSWSKGTGADQTHIRGSTSGYPADISSGYQVYFGAASSGDDTTLTANTTYYYRAWAYDSNSGYYSDGYDQDYETTLVVGATPTPTPTPTPTTTTTDDTGTMFIAFVLLPLGLFSIGLYWKKIWIVAAASIAFFGLGMFGLAEGSTGEGLWIIGLLCTMFSMLVALYAFFRMREKPEPVEEEIAFSPDEQYENELNSERAKREQQRKERRGNNL